MGERVRAERGESCPLHDGTYDVTLQGDALEDGYGYVGWFTSEPAALAFIDQVNTEPLPDGVYRNKEFFGLAAHFPLPHGWRWANVNWPDRPSPVNLGVEPAPAAPATERVAILQAVEQRRTAVAPDGSHMELDDDVIVYLRDGRWRLMFDDAGHAEERRPVAAADGTVEVLSLPEGEQQ